MTNHHHIITKKNSHTHNKQKILNSSNFFFNKVPTIYPKQQHTSHYLRNMFSVLLCSISRCLRLRSDKKSFLLLLLCENYIKGVKIIIIKKEKTSCNHRNINKQQYKKMLCYSGVFLNFLLTRPFAQLLSNLH